MIRRQGDVQLFFVVFAFTIFVVGFLWWLIPTAHKFGNDCRAHGGHVVMIGKTPICKGRNK